MNIFHRWKTRFSSQGKALSLYRRGMVRAKKHDHHGAVDDYTAAIEMPDAHDDVKAMALYNRALVLIASGDDQKGVDDLDVVLEMKAAPENVKTMARQKLAKRESRSRKSKV